MNNINLLPKKNATKDYHLAVRILRVSSIVLSASTVLISVWLFSARFDTTLAIQKQKQAELTIALTQLQSRAVKVMLLKERLTSISSHLSGRTSYETLISQLLTLMPAAVSIDELSIKPGTISIMLSSSSLQPLTAASDIFSELVAKKQLFKTVSIDDVTVENGKNSLTIKATLL